MKFSLAGSGLEVTEPKRPEPKLSHQPEQVRINPDSYELSFGDEQTRELLMGLLWARLQTKLEACQGIKKELYPKFYEIAQDLLDELAIEFRDSELHLNISLPAFE